MSGSLFSSQWYRVADRRAQLRGQVHLMRQTQRGVTWYVLQDPLADAGAQMHRVNRAGYEFVGRCDGRRTVQQIWDELLVAMPEDAPTQDEFVRLLVALHGHGLLQFDVAPDVEALFRRQDAAQRKRRRQGVNPWAFRLALFDPQPLLSRFTPLAPLLFNGWMFGLWLLLVLAGALAAAGHAAALFAHAAEAVQSPSQWFLAWLLYPPIKLVHESAHALAVARWGGEVRRAGITLLMLTPVPFVDASAADAFRRGHQRAVVSAAGIMAELVLAALALGVWLAVEPGRVRDAAMVVMTIGAMSSLLVNGNPLMRFDGYYLLCDLFDLRNLAPRSQRYWAGVLCRRLLGLAAPGPAFEAMPGERRWLFAYAPLAWLWRAALGISLSLWLGSLSVLLGALSFGSVAFATLLRPLWNAVRTVRALGEQQSLRGQQRFGLGLRVALAVAALGAALSVPLPFATLAEGIVWLPEKAQLRSASEGFVSRVVAHHGDLVKAGDVLLELDNPALLAERAGHLGNATELEVQLFDAMANNPQQAPALRERLASSRADIERLDQKIEQLQVRARVDGRLVLPQQDTLAGSFAKEGALLGHVLTDDPIMVRLALPQQDAALVQGTARGVRVRLNEFNDDGAYDATLRQDMPAAVTQLPSAALGDRGGGRILTDGSDSEGLKTRSAVVLLDVEVPGVRTERIGARAWVRFDHGRAPLLEQALRALQQALLQHFNPSR